MVHIHRGGGGGLVGRYTPTTSAPHPTKKQKRILIVYKALYKLTVQAMQKTLIRLHEVNLSDLAVEGRA